MPETTMLDRLSVAARLLAEAKTMDDIRQVRDVAEMARAYAQAAKLGREAENDAATIRVKAERRAGEVLKERLKNKGGRPRKTSAPNAEVSEPTLPELGLTEHESADWQQAAEIPEPEFEERVTRIRERGGRVSTQAVLREPTVGEAMEDSDLVFEDTRPLRKALMMAGVLGSFNCYPVEMVIAYVNPADTTSTLGAFRTSMSYLQLLYDALEARSHTAHLEVLP